eukprot:10937384-Lingulodinium_polyedra.AAC.1
MATPRRCDLVALRRAARYLLGAPGMVYHVAWQREHRFGRVRRYILLRVARRPAEARPADA